MDFKSGNIVKIHPQILQAIIEANIGVEPSYGNDSYSKKLQHRLSEIFETEVSIYLTSTGTAANSLALSALTPGHGLIYSHVHAHVNSDECGAPNLFSNGAKIIPISGNNCKIDPIELEDHIKSSYSMRPHSSKPSCITVSQATECGTIYHLNELKHLAEIAQKHELAIHMDGARFTNSLVTLNCTPAEATWKSGVDILSFGATKNGAMAAEAVIIFNKKYDYDFDYRQKRAGQLFSKTRFFSCQFLAYLENELWLKNALHANKTALRLSSVFSKNNLKVEYPVEANEVFVRMPSNLASHLYKNNGSFYEWRAPDNNGNNGLYRFVTSCFTTEDELSKLDNTIQLI